MLEEPKIDLERPVARQFTVRVSYGVRETERGEGPKGSAILAPFLGRKRAERAGRRRSQAVARQLTIRDVDGVLSRTLDRVRYNPSWTFVCRDPCGKDFVRTSPFAKGSQMKSVRAILLFLALLSSTSALAQSYPSSPVPESNARRHKGFFLRLDGGIGYAGSSASQGGTSASISGASSQFGIAVGGAVAENVILAGDVWGGVLFSPSVTVNRVTGTRSSSASLVGFGPHFTYYFMPANVYLSLTPSLTIISLTYDGTSANTKAGFGSKIALGKEWWVGDHWGLGVAGQFMFSFNVDEGTNPPTWSTFAGGVAFSATLN